MTTENNTMLAHVESLPDLIRSEFKEVDRRVRLVLNHDECLSVKRIVITGCGDSHMAGVAAELAFEKLARVPTEPMRANTSGRYASPYTISHFPRNPLVIGISVSGTTSRTLESINLLKNGDRPTMAIVGNAESPLAGLCDKVIPCPIADFGHAPGVRTYRMSLMALYLLAIRLGEVKDLYSQDDASKLRQSLLETADAIEATIEAVNDKTRQLAEAFAAEKSHVFVGDGPNFATAMFGAAKVIESAGVHAMGQESEEWAHLQYFSSIESSTPTFLISPGYRGHDRVGDLLPPMKNLGRKIVAIVPEGDSVVAPESDWVLPVVGDVPEVFSPMVYAVATELFAAHMSDVLGEPFFRTNNEAYLQNKDIRVTTILKEIDG